MQNKTLRVCDKGGAVNVNSIGAWWPSDGVLGPVERHPLARHFLERCPEGRHMPRRVENKVNKNNEVRLIINLPPRHLKSLMASIAFPAWCLGHDPSAQILCVSYAQDLADKLARDCRSIMMSPWYRSAPAAPSRRNA
jgi:hypothetical protein